MAPVFGLVVIDMSEEQIHQWKGNTPIVPADWPGYSNILKLSKCFSKERVFDTRLWMNDEDNSTLLPLCGLGRANTPGAQLVSHLKELKATFVKKVQYSAFFESELERLLRDQGVTDIFLTGINTDYCIFATALDAFYRRFKIYLIEDACAAFNGPSGHRTGVADFERYFGTYGKVLTTTQALKVVGDIK